MHPVEFLKNLVFPIFCVKCEKEGTWLCEDCFQRLEIPGVNLCPVCSRSTNAGEACENCSTVSYLDGVTAYFNYGKDDEISELIKLFKYKYIRDLEDLWRKVVGLKQVTLPFDFDGLLIIPVPLHYLRERERGFNQAEVLAEIIADKFAFNVENNKLNRQRNTNQQVQLSGFERKQNLADAFVWKGDVPAPKNVLLVDDVYTTGSTMQECAKTLKKCGTKKVWGMALARDVLM